jgi:acetyl-CoA C-acetyltransferase
MENKKVVIVSALRLASGKFGGTLKDMSAADLGVPVVKELFRKVGISMDECDELIFGNGWQAGVGANVARQISVRAGLPIRTPAYCINKRCGSGLKSVILAAQAIKAGDAEVIVAGGTESMSNIPYILEGARWGYKMGDAKLIDAMHRDGFICPLAKCLMGETAEVLAEKYNIKRKEQDLFAFRSQQKAIRAIKEDKFKEEILSLEVVIDKKKGEIKIFDTDETPRFDTLLEKMEKLKPVFRKDGTITAGSSCSLADNASAVLVMSEEKAKELDVKPLAAIRAYASVGVNPEVMGIGAAEAIKKVLKLSNLKLEEINLIEINEAFAAQILAVVQELNINVEKLNVNGGAIAHGHPVGSTGSKILTTLLYEMKRQNSKYGLVSLCIGGGQGVAMIVERK